MARLIEDRLPEIAALCRRHNVRRLALFGSATGDGFGPDASDLGFLVEFAPLTPRDHADSYFGLLHGPEDLLARPVDLLERAPTRNPVLLESIEESKVVLYGAASGPHSGLHHRPALRRAGVRVHPRGMTGPAVLILFLARKHFGEGVRFTGLKG